MPEISTAKSIISFALFAVNTLCIQCPRKELFERRPNSAEKLNIHIFLKRSDAFHDIHSNKNTLIMRIKHVDTNDSQTDNDLSI